MNWDWNPQSWRKSIKVLLGIATIWPLVYMFVFMGAIFSMILFLPFSEKQRNHSCGSLDILQLDRRIKDGQIKQLTARPDEIIAKDRTSDCGFEVTITNEESRREILSEAREVVNGRPRVDIVEEERARPRPPLIVPMGFGALMVAHLFTILLMMGLMPLYIVLAIKNESLDQTARIVWIVLVCTIGMLANSVYWYLYVWRKPQTPPQSAPSPSPNQEPVP